MLFEKQVSLHLSRNSSHPTSLAIIDVSSPVIKRRQATTKKRSHRHDQFYEAWGPVESVSFAEWWPKHWRTIFGVDVGVRVVSKVEAQDLDEGVLCVVHVSELADKFVKNPRAKISFRLRTGNSNVVFTPVRTVDAVAAIQDPQLLVLGRN